MGKQGIVYVSLLMMSGAQAAGDVENGKTVYLEQGCYSCHGYNGTGRRPLANDASGIMASEQVFLSYLRLRADVAPLSPSNNMPNYSVDVLSDTDAIDAYAYIKTFTDDPPEVDDIPAFQEIISSAEGDNDDDSGN